MTKALAAENVRQMHLDDRQFGGEKRVEHCHRGVGQRPGIENDAVGGFARLLDPVDELALVIGLPTLELQFERCGADEASLLDVGQSIMAINRGIPYSEQIEVGTVQNINGRQL